MPALTLAGPPILVLPPISTDLTNPFTTTTGNAATSGIANPVEPSPGPGVTLTTPSPIPLDTHWYNDEWVGTFTVLLFIYAAVSALGMLYAAFRYMDRRCFGADHDEDDDSDHSEYLILEGRRREGRPESPLWVTVDFQDETGSSRVDGDDEERLAWNHHETVRIGEGLTRSGMV